MMENVMKESVCLSTFRNSLALYSLSLALPLRWFDGKKAKRITKDRKKKQNNNVHEAKQATVQRPIRETVLYYVLWFTFHIYISFLCAVRTVNRNAKHTDWCWCQHFLHRLGIISAIVIANITLYGEAKNIQPYFHFLFFSSSLVQREKREWPLKILSFFNNVPQSNKT